MDKTSLLAASAAIALSAAPPAASADYQYIISGDPAGAATAGIAVGESATGPLEVRERVVAESPAGALTSKKPVGTVLLVR